MAGPGSWLRQARERLGERGFAGLVLGVLLVAVVAPLVALPAVRCEVFGLGCRKPPRPPAAEPAAGHTRQVPPLEAATQGRYVALGDSYSAGEGAYAGPIDLNPANRCHRTSLAYYHSVAKAFGFKGGTAFWACSGATTSQVLKGKHGEPPQTDRINADTSLVTLSVGGNDAGFSKVLAKCVVRLPWSKDCEDQGGVIADRLAALRQSLSTVLDTITARAPRARVVVLGYPRIFSEVSGADGDNLSIDDQRWLNGRARDLNELIRQIVTDADHRVAATKGQGSVEFIDAYNAFSGHEIGSADPYVNGLGINLAALAAEPRSFHPTENGYKALTALFIQQIKTGPGRPLNQFR